MNLNNRMRGIEEGESGVSERQTFDKFAEQIGESVTPELAVKHAADFDWDRMADKLLSEPAQAAYAAAVAPARATYEADTKTAWIVYQVVEATAQHAYQVAVAQARAEYQADTNTAWESCVAAKACAFAEAYIADEAEE